MFDPFKNIRAICTDIDGTLLDCRRELSPRTLAIFKRVKQDIPVILASSRMPSAMRHLQAELDILHHPLICYNGGYVLHYADHDSPPIILDSVIIPVSICTSILQMTEGKDIHVSLYESDNWYAPAQDQWTDRESRITKVFPIIKDLQHVLNQWQQNSQGAHKVMCMGPEADISMLEASLKLKFFDQLHAYRSKSTYLEIAPKSISKASALKHVLQRLYQIDIHEAIAFGDNYNDIEMLQTVGWGVAVSNAREEVKAVANEITDSNKEDGVAKLLEKYFSETN